MKDDARQRIEKLAARLDLPHTSCTLDSAGRATVSTSRGAVNAGTDELIAALSEADSESEFLRICEERGYLPSR